MPKFTWLLIFSLAFLRELPAGPASGTYRTAEGEFSVGYALADRAADGSIRILLTRQDPNLPDGELHLDRIEALGQRAEGGYLMLEPTVEGDRFNITVSVDGLGFGGGGQYESEIEFGESVAKGKIESEVLNGGNLKVSFEAEYLPERRRLAELPPGGGAAGTILIEQMRAVASGDREAILQTLEAEQREQFAQMSAEEQAEALSFLIDLTPKNVKVTGGILYDGYAIVEFTGQTDGVSASGKALIAQQGEQWRIIEVSTKLE